MKEKIIQKKNIYDDKCCSRDGGMSYDSVNFVCTMENKIVKKANQRTLCGREEYNPSHDLCCNYRVFKNASRDGMSCCPPNASIYNPKTPDCCHGTKIKHIRYPACYNEIMIYDKSAFPMKNNSVTIVYPFCLFFCLFVVLRSNREFFTHMETSRHHYR